MVVSKTKLVGILNLTPDSFSDGGKYNQLDSSLKRVKKLIDDGADIIDVGAESTRPKANSITQQEEWERLQEILPEIINLIKEKYPQTEISLDSRNYQTIKEGLSLGIDIINDVTGLEDQRIIDLVFKSGKKVVITHSLGAPVDPNRIVPENLDIIEFLIEWMGKKLPYLLGSGLKREQIIFDPGIGFGKNAQQSIKIVREIDRFKSLELPLFVGHSRKSFLDYFENDNPSMLSRDQKTLLISKFLIDKKIDYLRLHNLSGIRL